VSVPRWQKVAVISGRVAERLLQSEAGAVEVSLDLGRYGHTVLREPEEVALPDGTRVSLQVLAGAVSSPEDCIEIRPGECRRVYTYDESRRTYYKLYQPREGVAPTIVINGATMHPIVGTDPWQGTLETVRVLPPRSGECFDTCCGLGYSAQMLIRAGFSRVVTCEVDPNVLAIAARNPWSEDLFADERIEIVPTDLRQFARVCGDARFDCVFHDPPTIQQAGELYGEDLYRQLARVLKPSGILYHYVGAPGARRGQDYVRGVIRRLRSAGFARPKRVTGGVLAQKGPSRR
jgi:predicted methyltransferase